MIPDITELNFPKIDGKQYATLTQATANIADMGEKTITTQVKIDGEIVPDFSFDWEVEFQGEKYIMPLRIPQGAKENTSLNSTIDLTFQHWAIYQLKRWPFVTIQQIAAGTYLPDEEVATVQLNLKDFCILFGQVLEYYYGGAITIDFNDDPVTGWQYKQEATRIEISHTKIWNVLIDAFHDKYGVRWEIKAASDNSNTVKGGERYVIRVGYPTTEVDHIFEYGFEGGLLKVERQVQSEEIRNILKGRGGETNIPFRYFKDTDPNNPDFRPDPDWVEELANIHFTNLMPATFRSYVQGWKAAHISKYPGYKAVGESNAYAPWAYRKGYTDTKFAPVEFVADEITIDPETADPQVEILPGYSPYVKKGSSLDKYGPLPDTLDNNDDIYPTLQGTGMDIAVAVEQIESDDVAESTESDAQVRTLDRAQSAVKKVAKTERAELIIRSNNFLVETDKTANLDEGVKNIIVTKNGIKLVWRSDEKWGPHVGNFQVNVDNGAVAIEDTSLTVVNANTGATISASDIPGGVYYFQLKLTVHNTANESYNVTIECPEPKLTISTIEDRKWRNTFDIWVKNIWNTQKGVAGDGTTISGETDSQYAERVWKPVLGDREKNTAKVVFTSGDLALSEDYEFTIVDFPEPTLTPESIKVWTDKNGVNHSSHWKIKLAKSEAELEATGLYVPSKNKQGKSGDRFVFIGTEMTHVPYVVDAEERLDDWKKDQLGEVKEIKPTAVVTTDRVRLNNESKPNALINQLRVGNSLRLFDKRFFNEPGKAYETLYLQSITYTYREPSSDDAALNPDVEIVLGNEYTTSANPVSMMQGEISALQKQVGSISNVEQIVRAVGDRLYLRKDGISDRSLSPTQFFSLLTSGDFRAGIIGGAGWGFYKDENGNWVMETDRVNVRQEMQVNTLVINQAEGRGGMEIDTAAFIDGVTRVVDTDAGYVCYFDQKEGSVANLFHIDDVAYCNCWTPENTDLKFYKRRVVAVGTDNITLSKTDVNGSGIPAEGDNVIHFGNYTDKTRQYVKVRDVVGGGYERYIEELNSVNAAGVEYYFVGKQTGDSRWFVGNKDLIPYSGQGDGSYIEYINRKFNLNNVSLSVTSTIGNKSIGEYVGDAAKDAADKANQELEQQIKELQAQVDGVIESFNGFGAPTLSNFPANEWTTDEDRKKHNRDIYTDITPYVDNATTPTAGQSWKWYYNSSTDYGWTKIADSDAVKALQLAHMSIRETDVLYISHTSQTIAPELPAVNINGVITDYKGWQTEAPTWQNGKYIWQTTYVKKGNGSATFSGPTCISGINGQSITIKSKSVKYSTDHTSATQPADSTFTLTTVPTLTAGQYLWSRTEVVYSNNDSTVAYGVSRIGTNGTNGTSITIKSTSVTYAKTTTTTQPADSAFTYSSIGAAGVKAGEYLWTKTEIVYSDNTPVKTYSVSRIGSDGTNGTPGAPGTDGRTPYIHWAYANSADGVTNFSTTYFKDALYVGTCTDYNVSDPTTPSSYEWSRLRGEDGRGIVSVKEMYAVNNDSTTAPADSAFSETIPQTSATNRYLWNMETTTYTDNTSESTAKIIIGVHGANGEAGASITGVTNYYLASASATGVTTATAGWTTNAADSAATMTDAKPYLWNYEKITYSKGNPTQTTPHVVGRLGRGVSKIEEEYYLSTSQTQLAGGSWLGEANKPAWQPGKFMWTRTKVTYTDGKTEYMGAVCVTGAPGTSVLAQYSADGSAWHPTFATGDIWMRTSDDGGLTWSSAIRIVGEKGAAGADGQWRKFQWAKNNSTTTAPISGWQDNLMTAAAGEYVWMRSGIVVPPAMAPATWDAATRLTGDKGADGQSVYMLDIDNEVSGVICNASGTVTGSYPTPQASVYKGGTKLTSGIAYSIPQKTGISTVNITTAGAISMSGMTADKAEITVQARVDNVTLTSVISLYKVKPGASGQAAVVYSIEPSVNNITKSMSGALSATSVTCSVYKITGNSATALTNDHKLTYQRLPDGATGTLTRNAGVSAAVSILADTEAVIFELKNSAGALLDRERVPVLTDASGLMVGGVNLLRNTNQGVKTWQIGYKPGDGVFSMDADSTGKGVKFTNAATTTNTGWQMIYKPVQSELLKTGIPYRLSFRAKASTAGMWFIVQIRHISQGNYLTDSTQVLLSTSEKRYEIPMFMGKDPDAGVAYSLVLYIYSNTVWNELWLSDVKLEVGNVATEWTPSPLDFDYLTSALAESTVTKGGLILTSLIKVGINTNPDTLEQSTMAGISGIYNDTPGARGGIAVWTGGGMVDLGDPDHDTTATPATTVLRHDGSAYFCNNTVRLAQNVMEVGDSVELNKYGLLLNDSNGKQRLRISNTTVGDDIDIDAANIALNLNTSLNVSLGLRSRVVTIPGDSSGTLVQTTKKWWVIKGGTTTYTYSIPGTLTAGASLSLTSCRVNIDTYVVGQEKYPIEGIVTFKVGRYGTNNAKEYIAGGSVSVAINEFGRLYVPKENIQGGRYFVEVQINTSTQETTQQMNKSASLTVNGTAYNAFESTSVLGNDGLLSIWGNTGLLVNKDKIVMRALDYVLRITSTGIYKSTNGGKSWTIL